MHSDTKMITSHRLNLQKCRLILGQRISDEARNDGQKIALRIFLENLLHSSADHVNLLAAGPDMRLRVSVHAFVHRRRRILFPENQSNSRFETNSII